MPPLPSNLYAAKQLRFLSPWFEDVSSARMESLGLQGGFSGAIVWRVSRCGEDLCLRRWPQVHPTIEGLSAIHGLLQHVGRSGYRLAPVPLPTRSGETFFVNEDHLWELTPWMPGEASFREHPNEAKLASAMASLAEFHAAAKSYSFSGNGPAEGPSPGLKQRLAILHSLHEGGLDRLWKATRSAESTELRELALELLENIGASLEGVLKYLQQIVEVPLPLQWCLRDVRHDHLLFTGSRVTGLIDFGAVAVDSVAGDVARLIGSMVNDRADHWHIAIQGYHKCRSLSGDELRAVAGFDEGGALCSAANWVRWLFVEGRSFPQIHALNAQLVWLRDRLRSLNAGATASVGDLQIAPTSKAYLRENRPNQLPPRSGL